MKKIVVILVILFGLSACAASREPGVVPNAYDPIESVNRDIFDFNDFTQENVFNPIVATYNYIIPSFIRNRLVRFFDNLGEGETLVNSLLQAKFENAGLTISRFAINTTLGIGGLWDVATDFGVENKPQDFGMTLESYGVDEGPIITVPFLYPMSVRDGIGMIGDIFIDPIRIFGAPALESESSGIYWAYYGSSVFVSYSDEMDYLNSAKTMTLDPYSSIIKYSRLSRYSKFDDIPKSELKLESDGDLESVSYDFDFNTEDDEYNNEKNSENQKE